jgi:dienelactone hydrolase
VTYDVERIHFEDEPGCLFPAGGVTAHRYHPSAGGPRSRAGIVVLPIQGGDYEVSTLFAESFAKKGYQVLRFERRAEWLEADRDVAALGPLAAQYRQDVLGGIEHWLSSGPGAPERIGLFGVSMGAMMGTAVAANEPRIKASVLCIGGADLADILMTANDEEVNQYRKDLSARLGVPEAELRPMMAAALDPYDAAREAPKLGADSTLFIAARFDAVVRWKNSVRLWEALGRPKRVVLPTGHYSAVVFVPYIRLIARKWFDRFLLR